MKKNGFTIIELMIVLVIVSILVAFAITAYQTYVIKTRVIEGLELASGAKLTVSETAISNKALPATAAQASCNSPAATANVASIVCGDNGIITITFTEAAGDGTIIFTPTLTDSGGVSWDCTAGTLAAKYRPANCRKNF